MKNFIFIFFVFSFTTSLNSQTNFNKTGNLISIISTTTPTLKTTHNPIYTGGTNVLEKELQTNLIYPELAKENGIEGDVRLKLSINKNGEIINIKVLETLGGGCKHEAIRLVKLLSDWEPARLNGHTIDSDIVLKINFSLW